jgi:hypothetical protein
MSQTPLKKIKTTFSMQFSYCPSKTNGVNSLKNILKKPDNVQGGVFSILDMEHTLLKKLRTSLLNESKHMQRMIYNWHPVKIVGYAQHMEMLGYANHSCTSVYIITMSP